jgi:ABC-2 type transport system ATP-binding protein
VLVMDEPAANLDPAARKIFFELLAELAERTTMLISSHRINEVSSLVSRVIELDLGKVVLDDRIATQAELGASCAGRIVCRHPEPALAKALAQWNFRPVNGSEVEWIGEVAAPDRLRFLGTVSRYASSVKHMSLEESR